MQGGGAPVTTTLMFLAGLLVGWLAESVWSRVVELVDLYREQR